MSWYRHQLEAWLAELDVKAGTVLDIGGKQGEVKKRTKSWDVKEYKVLDIPEFDIEKNRIFEEADIIFCLEVFEYLINPLEAMKNIKLTLKKGGKAYITFAFAYPHHNELELDSLRYTETGIKRIVNKVGLKVTDIRYRTDRTGLLKAFYQEDGMHPSKQYHHHDVTGFIVEVTK